MPDAPPAALAAAEEIDCGAMRPREIIALHATDPEAAFTAAMTRIERLEGFLRSDDTSLETKERIYAQARRDIAKHRPAPEAGFVLVPEGWKLVPQWPTEEQISNVKATAASCHMDRCKTPEVCAYHAAIEVAPAPPAPEGERQRLLDEKTPAPDVARKLLDIVTGIPIIKRGGSRDYQRGFLDGQRFTRDVCADRIRAALAPGGEREGEQRAGCADCHRPYGDEHGFPDLIVPLDVWRRISPSGDEGGLLCPSCICARLHKAGIRCEGAFTSGPIESVSRPTMYALRYTENLREQLDRLEARVKWSKP